MWFAAWKLETKRTDLHRARVGGIVIVGAGQLGPPGWSFRQAFTQCPVIVDMSVKQCYAIMPKLIAQLLTG